MKNLWDERYGKGSSQTMVVVIIMTALMLFLSKACSAQSAAVSRSSAKPEFLLFVGRPSNLDLSLKGGKFSSDLIYLNAFGLGMSLGKNYFEVGAAFTGNI